MSDKPREGIYLDAALGVIGEQLEERIDELSRRRRIRTRIAVTALALTALAGGSAGAYALVSSAQPPPKAPVAEVQPASRLSCVEGADAAQRAYFTVSYRAASDLAVDAAKVCTDARATLASDQGRIAQASPADLVAIARSIIGVDGVKVDAASFGALADRTPTGGVVCEGAHSTVVITAPQADAPRTYTTCSVGGR